MSIGRVLFVFGTVAALTILAGPVAAQQGTLVGTVNDEVTGNPVPLVEIQILGGGESQTVSANNQGRYNVQLPAGTYDLVVSEMLQYRDERFNNVGVPEGQTTTYDLTLRVMQVQGINITVERSLDGQAPGDSPQTVYTVEARDIVGRANTNPTDLLVRSPAVDIIKGGLQTGHVVVRSFNNIFSGALHMLTDYRLAGVPSLRVNLMHFIPSVDEDFERIEVVMGPSSALYGPNTANGIVHFITKSPLESQGTTVTLGGGERSTLQGSLRSAVLVNEDLGIKISGQYMRGDEWNHTDPTEEAGRLSNVDNPALCEADKVTRGLTPADAKIACERLGVRDFGVERWSVEARADYRFADDGTIVGTYGRNTSSGIELTGLGAGQISEWGLRLLPGPRQEGSLLRTGLLQHGRFGRQLPSAFRSGARGPVVALRGDGPARVHAGGRSPGIHVRRRLLRDTTRFEGHDLRDVRGRRRHQRVGGLPPVEDGAHRSARLHSGGPSGFKLAVGGRRVLHEGCLCVPTAARA